LLGEEPEVAAALAEKRVTFEARPGGLMGNLRPAPSGRSVCGGRIDQEDGFRQGCGLASEGPPAREAVE
jgi:hypothetical protein